MEKKDTAKLENEDPHTTEIKRYLGALSEDFQHRVAAIGEQFGGLNRKIEEFEVRFDHIDQRFDRMDQRLDKMDQTLNSHTEMIGRIMIDIEEIKSGMREKVDRTEFVKLEKRLVTLEAVVFGGKKK